jgi:ribosome-associated translation inhibitor RaiA
MSEAVVAIHFKDMAVLEEVRGELERRCHELAGEFPELTHVDVTLSPDGSGHHASARASGRRTELASHAQAPSPGHAAHRVLDQLRHQLRRGHDKRVFSQRRRAKPR